MDATATAYLLARLPAEIVCLIDDFLIAHYRRINAKVMSDLYHIRVIYDIQLPYMKRLMYGNIIIGVVQCGYCEGPVMFKESPVNGRILKSSHESSCIKWRTARLSNGFGIIDNGYLMYAVT